jgi:cobalt-zinc-cadmium efflux system protein
MSHNHSHEEIGNIKVAFFLNLSFTLLEIIGGLWTNSLAILSDAIHDLGDSASLGLAWYFERLSEKEENGKFSYGYRRFSLLGAFINITILIIGSLVILSEAIPRLLNPQNVNAPGMIVFAIVGILVNGLAVLRLRKGRSMNARVVTWHLVEDVLGWFAVLIVSVILVFYNLPILDPVLSILITALILYKVIGNLRKTVELFLQAVPDDRMFDDINRNLSEIENVESIHHTHIWTLDGAHHVLTTHVVVQDDLGKEQVMCVKTDIRNVLCEYDFSHITVEIEYGDSDCMMAEI